MTEPEITSALRAIAEREASDLLSRHQDFLPVGIPPAAARRFVKRLRDDGLIQLEPAFSHYDGMLCGSGYMLTPAGRARLRDGAP